MRFGHRECPACGERSPRADWWANSQPITTSTTRLGGMAGISPADVMHYGWGTFDAQPKAVIITCPKCGYRDTARHRRGQRVLDAVASSRERATFPHHANQVMVGAPSERSDNTA